MILCLHGLFHWTGGFLYITELFLHLDAFQGNGYTSKGSNSVKIVMSPSEKGSSVKGISFLLKQTRFPKGHNVQKSLQEVTKVVPSYRKWWKKSDALNRNENQI